MADRKGLTWAFHGEDCGDRAESLTALGIHLFYDHNPATKAYYEELGAFWGQTICYCEKHTPWPVGGERLNARRPDVLTHLHPQDSVEAARYWTQGTEAEDQEEDEAGLHMQAQEGQVQGNHDDKEARSED
jgi:hypothetical protein